MSGRRGVNSAEVCLRCVAIERAHRVAITRAAVTALPRWCRGARRAGRQAGKRRNTTAAGVQKARAESAVLTTNWRRCHSTDDRRQTLENSSMACVCFLPNGRPYWSLPLPLPVTGVLASIRSPPMAVRPRPRSRSTTRGRLRTTSEFSIRAKSLDVRAYIVGICCLI